MFYLMCKDDVRASFDLEKRGIVILSNLNIKGLLPLGCTTKNFLEWLNTRHAAKHRSHLQGYLNNIGCCDIIGFLRLTHGISINDCYWVKEDTEDITWLDVSPYRNDFDEIIQKLAFDGVGLFGEQMSSTSPEFGTNGAFDKCWKRENSNIYLYKRGSELASNSGLEPYCEVLASQIFNKMKIGISYELVNFRGKVASKCKLFNNEDVSFVPYSMINANGHSLQSILEYYDSIGNSTRYRRMLVCDAITFNTDRHMGNHGVYCDSTTGKVKCIAPAFDYNLSMLPYVTRDEFSNITEKIIKQKPKNESDFIGMAKFCMSQDIRNDLINLRGIELTLPFTDDKFPEERVHWMTDIVNAQIVNILYDREVSYPSIKVDGLSNIYRYKLKFKMSDDELEKDIPRLMKVFKIEHMSELEEKIVELL